MEVKLCKRREPGGEENRAIYAQVLTGMMDAGEPVLCLDADLMRALGVLPFRDRYPDSILDCGIAEGNMYGIAAGLSLEGFVPFAHTFGVFASRRAFDQIFMSGAYAGLNVKVVGSDPGFAAELNGGTHQALEDVGLMRCVPGMTIVEPTDGVMLRQLLPMIAGTYGMFYLRLDRSAVPTVYEAGSTFELGKAVRLREGDDATIIAAGTEVAEALEAADMLAALGVRVRVRVLDMFTIKPLDGEAVLAAARETGAIVTAENHNVIGGLGSAVAEFLGEHCPVPMGRIGVRESFGQVGKLPWLKERYGLTARDISQAVIQTMERKLRAEDRRSSGGHTTEKERKS